MDITINTEADLEAARAACPALDQSRELTLGAHTWLSHGATLTEWPDGAGAIATNGVSEWGDWHGDLLYTDAGVYGRDGAPWAPRFAVGDRVRQTDGLRGAVVEVYHDRATYGVEWEHSGTSECSDGALVVDDDTLTSRDPADGEAIRSIRDREAYVALGRSNTTPGGTDFDTLAWALSATVARVADAATEQELAQVLAWVREGEGEASR